jgi:hypothetical protein
MFNKILKNEKINSCAILLLGAYFLCYSVVNIIVAIIYLLNPSFLSFIRNKPVFTMFISIFFDLIVIFWAVNIIKLKYWARYLGIAFACFTLFGLIPIDLSLKLGFLELEPIIVIKMLLYGPFLLWFLTRELIIEKFQTAGINPRVVSFYKILISLIIVISVIVSAFTVIVPKAFVMIKYHEPLFLHKPNVINLEMDQHRTLSQKYIRREIMGNSLLIPYDFALVGLDNSLSKEKLTVFLNDPNSIGKGMIVLDSLNLYEKLINGIQSMHSIKLKKQFLLEKNIYSNSLSSACSILRYYLIPAWQEVFEINAPSFKGFLGIFHYPKVNRSSYRISIYDKNGDFLNVIHMFFDNKAFTMDDALNIVSSLTFVIVDKQDASKYYETGKKLIKSMDFIGAQFAFFNAYYLDNSNIEYAYSLANALHENGSSSNKTVRKILSQIIQINPKYKDTRKLLDNLPQEKENMKSDNKNITKKPS